MGAKMRQIKGIRVKEHFDFDATELIGVNKVLQLNYHTQVKKSGLSANEATRFWMWLVANGKLNVERLLEIAIKGEPQITEQLRYVLD